MASSKSGARSGRRQSNKWANVLERKLADARTPTQDHPTIAAIFIPCACREEVLGDFEERCTSPLQYCRDAVVTVPLVTLSRIRRTANPQLLPDARFRFL